MIADYAVAIVGAGPTGLTVANLLGKANIKAILIEANPATVAEPRAVSIDDESLRVLQGLGLLDEVQREIVSGYGSEYFGPAGDLFLTVKPRAQPYGHPRRNAFRQPVLEAQLRTGLARFASVETRFSCRVDSFDEGNAGVLLRLTDSEGGIRQIHADYVLACDGARSVMREQLGFKLEGSSLSERWLILDLENSPAASTETAVFCNPRRPCIALPGPHATRRYEFKLLPRESDAEMLTEARVSALLDSHDAAASSILVRKTVYHFHARIANRWGSRRIWLAGDAAHLMPPFAGQGMNSGIRDAANAGWKLAEVVRGRIGPLLMTTYERERRDHVQAMIRLALRMGVLMGPPSRLRGAITRNLFHLLKVWPAARSFFAEMKYKPAPQFAGGFLLRTTRSRRAVVGRMLPQPSVKNSDGSCVLLDDLLGDGFVLLGIDIGAESMRDLTLGPVWDALLAKRMVLTTGQVTEFVRLSGKFLLVRPDRYVMACFSAAELAKAVRQLDQLWRKTWPQENLG